MAKKAITAKKAAISQTSIKAPLVDPAPAAVALETPARKSVLPKTSPAGAAVEVTKAPVPLTYERIAERAYHISQSGHGSSEDENWLRAERELKSES